ncbi:Coiled-coil domain-containing protein 81 [Kappamyces sp. JEL0829]|nr:Coiled-coil domain-containing protein 81 [Kappamyces sp. JEL0829]
MDKIDLEDIVAAVCEQIAKNKRFSELTHIELCDLWKGVCKYLNDQLLLRKSIHLHGIGSFFTKKTKRVTGDAGVVWSVHFCPSKSWDKLAGFQIDRTVTLGTGAAEPLNLAAVAVSVGFTRDLVEAGIKDIVNGLTKLLRKGTAINLTMGAIGKIIFQSNDIKFKFFAPFVRSLNEDPAQFNKPRRLNHQNTKEMDAVPDKPSAPTPPKESVAKTEARVSIAKQAETAVQSSPECTVSNDETRKLTLDLDEAAQKLARLENLIDQTFSAEARSDATHTHFYSGNRLWSNNKCPICKTEAMKNIVDLEGIKKAEKENDKMLLHISLDIDKEYLDKRKEKELQRQSDSVAAAQYNYRASLENQEKLGFKEKQPMGDLFEKRKIQRPIMTPNQMAEGIHEQITAKRERTEKSAQLNALQDKLVCEKLKKEYVSVLIARIKAAELQAHLNKTQRYQQMRASLAEQIKISNGLKEKEEPDPTENPFARSESLMALYQREKAKQLYYEQLAIVRQKQDYAQKVSDIERRHSLHRLDISRKELEKDLKAVKREKAEMRRSLEGYWSDQLHWQKANQAPDTLS